MLAWEGDVDASDPRRLESWIAVASTFGLVGGLVLVELLTELRLWLRFRIAVRILRSIFAEKLSDFLK